jgi:PhnB protein
VPTYPKPKGHHTVTPCFFVPRAREVLAFLEKAFGARVVERSDGVGGAIAHCEVRIGDAAVLFADVRPGWDAMPLSANLYVRSAKDVDATYERAIRAGAVSRAEPADQFFGMRTATVRDVGGNEWSVCAVIERLTRAQKRRRSAAGESPAVSQPRRKRAGRAKG